MTSLPDLLFQSIQLAKQIEESTDDVFPHELMIAQEETDIAIKQKVDSYSSIIDHFERDALKWKEQEQLCKAQKQKANGMVDRLKTRLKEYMGFSKRRELVGNYFRFLLTDMQPKLVIDEEKLPREYMMPVTTYVPDKEVIRYKLERGEIIEGAHLEPVQAMRRYP